MVWGGLLHRMFGWGMQIINGDPSENSTPKLILILPLGHSKDWRKLESTHGWAKSTCPEQLLKLFSSLNIKEIHFSIKSYWHLQHRWIQTLLDIYPVHFNYEIDICIAFEYSNVIFLGLYNLHNFLKLHNNSLQKAGQTFLFIFSLHFTWQWVRLRKAECVTECHKVTKLVRAKSTEVCRSSVAWWLVLAVPSQKKKIPT